MWPSALEISLILLKFVSTKHPKCKDPASIFQNLRTFVRRFKPHEKSLQNSLAARSRRWKKTSLHYHSISRNAPWYTLGELATAERSLAYKASISSVGVSKIEQSPVRRSCRPHCFTRIHYVHALRCKSEVRCRSSCSVRERERELRACIGIGELREGGWESASSLQRGF